jgi:ABC-type glycerol-3-phosphate transport system substrate-binding protein
MNSMNTRRLSLLGLILILLLAACGGETTPEEAAGSESAMVETAVVGSSICS